MRDVSEVGGWEDSGQQKPQSSPTTGLSTSTQKVSGTEIPVHSGPSLSSFGEDGALNSSDG
jgi:hypothetical protein